MAASSGPADAGNEEKPSFTFEQIVLRFVVGIMFLALFVMVVEFGQVRGRIQELETGGAPAPRQPRRTRWAHPSRSRSCSKRWRSSPRPSRSPPAPRSP